MLVHEIKLFTNGVNNLNSDNVCDFILFTPFVNRL
jgi:hypothetical protein